MGGFAPPPIPQIPRPAQGIRAPARGPGSRGPLHGGGIIYPPPRGTYGYQPSPMEQAVHGVNNFVQSFQQSQQKEKQQAASEFWDSVQKLQAGIPIDMDKAARKARKAGIDLDFEGKNPPPQQQQGGNVLQRAGRAVTGALGMRQPPPVPRDAGVFNLLQQAQQQGQQALKRQQLAGDVKTAQLELLKGVLQGKPEAKQTARMMGITEKMGFREEMTEVYKMLNPGMSDQEARLKAANQWLDAKIGTTERNDALLSLAARLAPEAFDNDVAKAQRYLTDIRNDGASKLKPSGKVNEKDVGKRMADYARILNVAPEHWPTLQEAAMHDLAGDSAKAAQLISAIEPGATPESVATKRYNRNMEVIGLLDGLLRSAEGDPKKAMAKLQQDREQYAGFYPDMLDWLRKMQSNDSMLAMIELLARMNQ